MSIDLFANLILMAIFNIEKTISPFVKNSFMAKLHSGRSGGTVNRISISERRTALRKILNKLQKKSGYLVIYDKADPGYDIPVSLRVKNASIETALALCFRKIPFSYKIIGKEVLISAPGYNSNSNATNVQSYLKIIISLRSFKINFTLDPKTLLRLAITILLSLLH